jgi:hypothetical protein
MKAFVFSATVWAIALAMVPGACACSGPTAEASAQRTGLKSDDSAVASDAGAAVLVGLLLGLVVADPVAAASPCPGCRVAR